MLLSDPAHTALTFGLAGLLAYFLMKVGATDSFYVAGIAAVSSIMAGVGCNVLVDCLYNGSSPQQQPQSPPMQSPNYKSFGTMEQSTSGSM